MKVGDKVVVKDKYYFDEVLKSYGLLKIIADDIRGMSEYASKIATITEVLQKDLDYSIDLDGGKYIWGEDDFDEYIVNDLSLFQRITGLPNNCDINEVIVNDLAIYLEKDFEKIFPNYSVKFNKKENFCYGFVFYKGGMLNCIESKTYVESIIEMANVAFEHEKYLKLIETNSKRESYDAIPDLKSVASGIFEWILKRE